MNLIENELKDKFPGTIINIILDESASMSLRQNITICAYNDYLEKQKESPEAKRENQVFWSLTRFSDDVKVDYTAQDITTIPKLTLKTYTPLGMTALYDAVGMTINSVEKTIKSWENKPSILTVIITDGEENSSKEFVYKTINQLITDKQKEGWTFVFLGAKMSAKIMAQQIGIDADNVREFDADNIRNVMCSLSNDTTRYVKAASYATAPLRNVSFFKNDNES